jgi:hypothetical protein
MSSGKRLPLNITVQRTGGRSVTVEASDPIGPPEKPLTKYAVRGKIDR